MRAEAPPATKASVAAGAVLDVVADAITALRRMAEQDAGRRLLWLPACLGAGIALYFALPTEPGLGASLGALVAAIVLRGLLQRWPARALAATALVAIALGATVAQWRSVHVAAPVLLERWGPGTLTGRVIAVEIRPEGRRLVLDRLELPGLPAERLPERVRLKLGAGQDEPRPGDRIVARAQLVPPPEPATPGAYDFARGAWFERIGGVGSIRGRVEIHPGDATPEWRLRLNAARSALVARVLELDPGPAGQVSAALLTGEMGHIAPEVMAQMRDSGLAHLLSISGLHISLVAGIVFLAVRRLAALVPPLALRLPVKKVAAAAAFVAISLYALFAAPGVPTARAWMMGTIVLLAILIDRSPLSIRLVAWAAAGVLLLLPEALLGPSFQMSFAAVLALIAAFEWLAPRLTRWKSETGPLVGIAIGAGAMLATTLVASIATAPFALYHFNRLALLGVLANLVAVPLTSLIVMPAAVLVFIGLPFGVEGPALQVMNIGNELVMIVAREAAALPGASSLWPAMPAWGLGATVIGGLWLCLWTQAWRLLGVPAVVLGLASPLFAAAPDILVSADGRAVALRREGGGLAMNLRGGSDFVRDLWLRRAGLMEPESWIDPVERGDATCRREACWVDRSHSLTAIVTASSELAAACEHATLLVTPLEIWRPCPGPLWLVDRAALRMAGAHAIWLGADGVPMIRTVRDDRGARSWVRPTVQ